MFAKTLIAAAAIAATFAVAAPVQQAQAKTNIDINLGFGFGGFDPGYGYGYGYEPVPVYNYGISCGKGAKIVKWSGFKSVNAVDCSKPVYQYHARKGWDWYRVKVNMNGNIISVKHL